MNLLVWCVGEQLGTQLSTHTSQMSREGYDKEEYARRAKEREQVEYEKRQMGGRVAMKEDAVEATARQNRLDIYEGLNKVTLVPAGASIGKRGKGAGFYCEVCNLTFKDSIQYTDHINSKQHLYASGQKEQTTRATLEDVKKRIQYLKNKKEQEQKESSTEFDINKRIEQRRKFEEEEQKARRERRAKRKRKNKEQPSSNVEADDGMAQMMGISGFGSTKH